MWYQRVNRQELLTALATPSQAGLFRSVEGDPHWPQLRSGEVVIFWRTQRPSELDWPVLLAVAPEEMRDFLAWAATYLQGYRPITAFCRVVSAEMAFHIVTRREAAELKTTEAGWVGGIIMETLESRREEPSPSHLAVRTCTNSYLFAAARSLVLQLSDDLSDAVNSRWQQCRDILGSSTPVSGELAAARREAAIALAGLREGADRKRSPFVEALQPLTYDRAVRGASWIRGVSSDLNSLIQRIEGPREDRIRHFDHVLTQARNELSRDPLLRGFVVGLALCTVGPGSLEHYEHLRNVAPDVPGAYVWYGVCAGLTGGTSIYGQFEALGRRIARELRDVEVFSAPPRCDIGLDELQLVATSRNPATGWRVAYPGLLTVEILPGIYQVGRWEPGKARQKELFGDAELPSTEYLDDVKRLLRQAQELLGSPRSKDKGAKGSIKKVRRSRA